MVTFTSVLDNLIVTKNNYQIEIRKNANKKDFACEGGIRFVNEKKCKWEVGPSWNIY